MALHGPFRRIITSHAPSDVDGTHVVVHDGTIPLTRGLGGRAAFSPIFAALGLPVRSAHAIGEADIAATHALAPGVVTPGGHNAQVTDLAPGARVDTHRTSSVDYNVFLQGSAWLITPDGSGAETRTLVSAGEVVVQRGAAHAWEAGDRGARWCTVVVAAHPVEAGGRPLPDIDFQCATRA
ncbi:hypothetical protein Q5752_006504 [Cryptotrichosporon argae]